MPTGAARRCGTCELLERSSTAGLETYGKCPHRAGWVRSGDDACAHHLGERPRPLVRVAMVANGIIATLGLGAFVVLDVREGNLATHVLLGVALAALATFSWLVRRHDLLSEEPKYDLLDEADPPPEEDRHWWMDPR
jgi:hypothetical protein